MKRLTIVRFCAIVLIFLAAPVAILYGTPKPPKSLRLYVFDCGRLTMRNPGYFGATKEQVGEAAFLDVPAYLVVSPKGTLMWDSGIVPDSAVGTPQAAKNEVTKTLRSQLAEIGYAPEDIKYFALSHLHADHTGNANEFAGSTWLVHQTERDHMFGGPRVPGSFAPDTFSKLKDSKTIILPETDYDVFGDGTAIIKYAPGHTPGQQILLLKLKESGPILITGDVYHIPQEISMNLEQAEPFDKVEAAATRKMVLATLKQTGARLWSEHDLSTFLTLKMSPDFYQ